MKKILLPALLALLGLGAGVGAGLALRPAPETASETDSGHAAAAEANPEEGPDVGSEEEVLDENAAGFVAVPFGKPFVVPVFHEGATTAMVVLSLAIEVEPEAAEEVTAAEPKLRDGFLKAMFRHAGSGGFDGDFTTGAKMDDLKAALRKTLRTLLPLPPTGAVLVTEIARQDQS